MYPAKLSDIVEEERKAIHNMDSLKIFIFSKPNLKTIQEAIF